ncbi:MAG: hypothetical protein KIT79_09350 [Deltaproteobacteria bacterium]|nr:hypothetical protein [Deltaproteobacteria bacterium]
MPSGDSGVRGERASFYEENYLANLIAWDWPRISEKIAPVLVRMVRYLLLMPHRLLLGWLLVLLTLQAARELARRDPAAPAFAPHRLLLASAWMYLAAVYLMFLVSPWYGDMQVRAAFDRILTHLGPVMGVAAVLQNSCTPPYSSHSSGS